MAISVLPYPDIDFIPLDILTADELNQIVANITTINNATIGTDSIANSSITSDKINMSQFAPFKYTNEEQAIGTWIDGRTIYRRAYEFTTGSAIRSLKTITGAISGLSRVINMYGSFIHTGGDTPQYSIIHAGNPSGTIYEFISFSYSMTNGFQEIHNYTYANSQQAIGIIEYTK